MVVLVVVVVVVAVVVLLLVLLLVSLLIIRGRLHRAGVDVQEEHGAGEEWDAIGLDTDTASFHNFKSQNFKLSISNPKSKYVAYVSVLSRISNSQGLGRKNKFEI